MNPKGLYESCVNLFRTKLKTFYCYKKRIKHILQREPPRRRQPLQRTKANSPKCPLFEGSTVYTKRLLKKEVKL